MTFKMLLLHIYDPVFVLRYNYLVFSISQSLKYQITVQMSYLCTQVIIITIVYRAYINAHFFFFFFYEINPIVLFNKLNTTYVVPVRFFHSDANKIFVRIFQILNEMKNVLVIYNDVFSFFFMSVKNFQLVNFV